MGNAPALTGIEAPAEATESLATHQLQRWDRRLTPPECSPTGASEFRQRKIIAFDALDQILRRP